MLKALFSSSIFSQYWVPFYHIFSQRGSKFLPFCANNVNGLPNPLNTLLSAYWSQQHQEVEGSHEAFSFSPVSLTILPWSPLILFFFYLTTGDYTGSVQIGALDFPHDHLPSLLFHLSVNSISTTWFLKPESCPNQVRHCVLRIGEIHA